MKLQNKVAIITGATKGIGVACAQEFVKEGAKVVAAGRSVDLGEAVAADIRAAGGDAIFVQCDVSKKAEVDALVAKTVEQYGTVDIVVNNAGVNHSANFFDTTEEDWDWVMSVDLKGTFLLSQAAARDGGPGQAGRHRQCLVGDGPARAGRPGSLLRGQGRGQPAHQGDGAGADQARHPRQRGRARPGDDRADGTSGASARRSTRC